MISNFKKLILKSILVIITFITLIGITAFTNAKAMVSSVNNISKKLCTENSLLFQDKDDVVNLWAEALKQRSGAFRFAILTNELKAQEYKKYNDMNWVIGVSSPWVVDYAIKVKNKIDDETYEYEINYTMTDSTKARYYSSESIIVKKYGNNWFVTKHDNYDYIPNITKSK